MVRRGQARALWLVAAIGAAEAFAAPEPDLLLEAELDPPQVLVQAQAVYRFRFFQAVDVKELKIVGPSARLANVRAIGTERLYEALRDGRRYRVRERGYAIFPFASGALELAGAHALGRVAAPGAKSADGRQMVRFEAPVRTLTVAPVPAAAGAAAWLPARSVTLGESWSPAGAEGGSGLAQKRSLRIEALGVDAGQIPPVQFDVPGMIIDAEPPRLENRFAGDLNVGVREQVFRLTVQRAGDIAVPELRLAWWNILSGAPASAVLPARTLHVGTADGAASAMPSATPAAPTRPWLALLAFLLCAGLALGCTRQRAICAAWRLWSACRRGDAAMVRDGLLLWAAARWPRQPPMTLEALGERLADPAAREALDRIDRCLYGRLQGRCDAATLSAAVRAVKGEGRKFESPSSTAGQV